MFFANRFGSYKYIYYNCDVKLIRFFDIWTE